ncbi:hypothetical protein D3C87_1699890 [compost metagenome]
MSISTSDRPTSRPWALRKVKIIPPPMTRVSTLPIRLSSTPILLETLDPPMMATKGRSGLARALPITEISLSSKKPAAAGR